LSTFAVAYWRLLPWGDGLEDGCFFVFACSNDGLLDVTWLDTEPFHAFDDGVTSQNDVAMKL
jgi:hypothetical protein